MSADGRAAPPADRVCAAFDLGSPRGAMTYAASGEQGVIWRLDTDRGRFAVKHLLIRLDEESLGDEVALVDAALAASAVTLPRPVRTPAGRLLADVGDWQLRVGTWVDIADPDPSIDPAAVGRMLAALHRTDLPASGPVDPWYTAPVGEPWWRERLGELDALPDALSATVVAALPEVIALEGWLVEPTRLQVCHRDLWADNVRAMPTGGWCVIDWDNTGPEDAAHELAMVVWEFGLDDDARMEALIGGYASAGGPARLTAPSDFTMLIAQFGHFYEQAMLTWLDPAASPEDRAWARGRFEELVSRPLTRATVERAVDVCSAAAR